MIWLPLGVLIGGVVLALVVFGFGAYELTWKARRLRADLARLTSLGDRLAELQQQVRDAQERIADAGSR